MATDVYGRKPIDEELATKLVQLLHLRYEPTRLKEAEILVSQVDLYEAQVTTNIVHGKPGYSVRTRTNVLTAVLWALNTNVGDYFRWCMTQSCHPLSPKECATLESWIVQNPEQT